MTGGVESTLIVTGAAVTRPAPFAALQVSVVLAVTAWEAQPADDAMPDSGSAVVQATATLPVYQPLAPAVPVILGTITGGVRSIFTVTGTVLVNPSPLVAEQVKVVPGVLAASVTGSQPFEEPMPESGSAVDQVTVTAPVYQPLAPSWPMMDGTTIGGV